MKHIDVKNSLKCKLSFEYRCFIGIITSSKDKTNLAIWMVAGDSFEFFPLIYK